MNREILSAIEEQMPGFSKGQKRIAQYILENYDRAAFMTASKLGDTAKVSESTVVRFATELGYSGYPAMRKALQDMIRNKLTSVQRIEVARDTMGSRDVFTSVLQSDIGHVRKTLEDADGAEFERAVETVLGARSIYILGVRSSSALSQFLEFYFHLIFENVTLISTNSISEMYERLYRMSSEDVIIGISFPRYSRAAVKAMQFARDRGAGVIAITDSDSSPIAKLADVKLFARSEMLSFVDSLAAPLSLINALIVAVGTRKGSEVSETFEKLERIWDEYEVYEKIED